MDIGSATDVGRVREMNEDALLVVELQGARQGQLVVAIADGMGGHNAGEVASALAVDSVRSAIEAEAADRSRQAGDLLVRAIGTGNRNIWNAAAEDPAKDGMGTTFVCALVNADGSAVVANVGDSRAYVLLSGEVELVTADHTWVNEQVLAGAMSEREARASPFRNLLTRTLGNSPSVEVDVFEDVKLEAGDALVLVSDGVTGYLDAGDIREILVATASAQASAERLVAEAVARGGADNATAVVVRR